MCSACASECYIENINIVFFDNTHRSDPRRLDGFGGRRRLFKPCRVNDAIEGYWVVDGPQTWIPRRFGVIPQSNASDAKQRSRYGLIQFVYSLVCYLFVFFKIKVSNLVCVSSESRKQAHYKLSSSCVLPKFVANKIGTWLAQWILTHTWASSKLFGT